jgi:hypothetical protein
MTTLLSTTSEVSPILFATDIHSAHCRFFTESGEIPELMPGGIDEFSREPAHDDDPYHIPLIREWLPRLLNVTHFTCPGVGCSMLTFSLDGASISGVYGIAKPLTSVGICRAIQICCDILTPALLLPRHCSCQPCTHAHHSRSLRTWLVFFASHDSHDSPSSCKRRPAIFDLLSCMSCPSSPGAGLLLVWHADIGRREALCRWRSRVAIIIQT